MPRYEWTLKLYNLSGSGITAASIDPSLPVNNSIRHAIDRKVHFVLDEYESLEFSLYLHDPMAYQIRNLSCVVKLWRKIIDDNGSTLYEDAAGLPAFAGVVGFVSKDGASNIMQVKAYSPLWRLKFRFHILNHYLQHNPDTGSLYKQSELIWKLIDLINGAFGVSSFTGIVQGAFSWAQEPTMAPFFVGKGSNTWSNVYDLILARKSSPEIIPVYTHSDGSPNLMTLNTNQARGTNKTSTIYLRYRTGLNDNLDNVTETEQISPDEFACYLWAVGQGGPNSGKIALRQEVVGPYGRDNVGQYMKRVDTAIKLFDESLDDIAEGEFHQVKTPPKQYDVAMAPAVSSVGPFYAKDFSCGDAVRLVANRGAMSIVDLVRLYNASISISNNNVETVSLQVGEDINEKLISSEVTLSASGTASVTPPIIVKS